MQAVLFDLDGTLADTAADLTAAASKVLCARGMDGLSPEALRLFSAEGVAGVARALGIDVKHRDFPLIRQEFLANYAADLCVNTVLFPGIELLLADILSRGIRWGIVTNKIAQFTEPLIVQLNLHHHLSCLVSGDTTAYSKPHPAPLLYAARQLNVEPAQVVYVGDHLRDIQAGRAAGMLTIAAAYGYCDHSDQPPTAWQADHIAYSTQELHTLLLQILQVKASSS